jgi:hypothetical protein
MRGLLINLDGWRALIPLAPAVGRGALRASVSFSLFW